MPQVHYHPKTRQKLYGEKVALYDKIPEGAMLASDISDVWRPALNPGAVHTNDRNYFVLPMPESRIVAKKKEAFAPSRSFVFA